MLHSTRDSGGKFCMLASILQLPADKEYDPAEHGAHAQPADAPAKRKIQQQTRVAWHVLKPATGISSFVPFWGSFHSIRTPFR